MTEARISSVESKIDLMLIMLTELKENFKECRKHCDATSSSVCGKINALEHAQSRTDSYHDLMKEQKFAKPHWLTAIGTVLLAALTVFIAVEALIRLFGRH